MSRRRWPRAGPGLLAGAQVLLGLWTLLPEVVPSRRWTGGWG
ncbi:hypothetical protein [Streptomyces deserti]